MFRYTVISVSVNRANSVSDSNRVSNQGASSSRIEADGDNSPIPPTSSLITSTNAQPVTFSEFCSHKESDRSKHFNRKKDGKIMKLHDKPWKSTEVKINIGIMTKREDVIVVKRGVTLPSTVRTNKL